MPDTEKMEKEKRSLKLVDDSFRKIIVVGEHTKTWSDENGIQIVSIYDFLLNSLLTVYGIIFFVIIESQVRFLRSFTTK